MVDAEGEYCDLVMKGGITSGLVYPTAAIALAERYRFKNIGGTSAGAIAASACAAAALGERRRLLSPEAPEAIATGFDGLGKAAADLRRKGFLYALFQPVLGTRAVYRTIVSFAGDRPLAGFAHLSIALLLNAGLWAALLFVLFRHIVRWAGFNPGLAAHILLLAGAMALALLIALFVLASRIRGNMMGLCSGKRPRGTPGRPRALTEWLHDVLQNLSGQPANEPLLFEHLWKAPRYPEEPETEKALSLRVITTGVSHHEPRSLPIEKRGGRFWFVRDDFDRLFPETVVDWMVALHPEPVLSDGRKFYQLPEEGALPVIVAARMSLSFPILISAVPLYEPDFRASQAGKVRPDAAIKPPKRALDAADDLTSGGARDGDEVSDGTRFRICWFSDGGISSNFPIHLFDSPLPRWPTFAIDLVYGGDQDGKSEPVSLPDHNNKGWHRRYQPIARRLAVLELGGFLFGIIGTMQNWRDRLLSRAPGHRERIVSVWLDSNEGGMNLNMPEPVLESISAKGTLAGATLVKNFDFANHWWIRWRNVAATSEMFLQGFAAGAGPAISPSYADAHSAAAMGTPDPPGYKFKSLRQGAESQRRFAELTRLGQSWGITTPSLTIGAPQPQPRLTITPIY